MAVKVTLHDCDHPHSREQLHGDNQDYNWRHKQQVFSAKGVHMGVGRRVGDIRVASACVPTDIGRCLGVRIFDVLDQRS